MYICSALAKKSENVLFVFQKVGSMICSTKLLPKSEMNQIAVAT
jgi:hypothetical protein